MMLLLFVLLLAMLVLAVLGKRKTSIWVFAITLALSFAWFWHHVTSHLHIQL